MGVVKRILRLVVGTVLALALTILGQGIYGGIMMASFDTVPYFPQAGETTFTCYMDKVFRLPQLVVSFSPDGRHAIVRLPDRDATTTFQRGGFAGDRYQGDGIELLIDPEAYVIGDDNRIGPCQRD